MSRWRLRLVVLSAGLLGAVGALLVSVVVAEGGSRARPAAAQLSRATAVSATQAWWGPPADVRAMLRQVSPANLQTDVATLVGFGTRHTLSSQTDPQRGIGAAHDWILSQLQAIAATSSGAMTVQDQTFTQPVAPNIPIPTTIRNVIATLKGTDASSSAVYVVSAHYDDRVSDLLDFTSDAPGADDDASGVSALLELARVFAAHPQPATIVFATFSGKEQGLYGSTFAANQFAAQGTNVRADLNMDIIGSPLGGNGIDQPHTISLYSEGIPTNASAAQIQQLIATGGENDGASRQLARYIAETGQNLTTDMLVKLVSRRDRYSRNGDQIPFQQQGFPAVRFTEPNENYDHEEQNVSVQNGIQFGDLAQFLDYGYIARVTRLVGSSLAALAESPQAPVNARVIDTPPSNDTELRWNANPESNVVGYEVVWRDSNAPKWTNAQQVGSVTDFTLPNLNKDNTQFGVRAINSAGDMSPIAYAVPAAQ